jgi:hypothetical protein
MKKTAEQEVQIKFAVRDLIVRNPLISGHQRKTARETWNQKVEIGKERRVPRLAVRDFRSKPRAPGRKAPGAPGVVRK